MSDKVLSPAKKAREYLDNNRLLNEKLENRLIELTNEYSLSYSSDENFNIVSPGVDDGDLPSTKKSSNSDIRNFLIGRQNLEYLEELNEERKANVENYPRYAAYCSILMVK